MLRFTGVSYRYPGATTAAVEDISLEVRPGELVLCTGPSGCGKSTLIRLANGLCPHFFRGHLQGTVRVQDLETTAVDLHELACRVGTLFQDPENQFFALTVEDELAFTHEWRGTPPAHTLEKVALAAKRFALQPLMGASILDLSEGQKQKVALATIISLGPGVLILDEPSANLDPGATMALAGELRRLREEGMAILVVDHRLYWLAETADRVLVMDKGRIVAEGGFDLLHDGAFRRRHGLRADRIPDPRPHLLRAEDMAGVLQGRGLCFTHRNGPTLFQDAHFSLPAGITGIIGDNGSGKTTLARLLTGLNRLQSGELLLHGRPLRPEELLRRSSIVLQNTDHQLHMHSVRSELIMAAAAGRPHAPAQEARADELLHLFNLGHLAQRHPQSLSGGEKQRLVIACGMARHPEILILDEPTSGLDGHNMALVAQSIRTAANQGAVVLLISHDLELLALSCDAGLHLPLGPTCKERSCSPSA